MIAYDKVLKNAAQKLGKKYDAKVNQEPLQKRYALAVEGGDSPQPEGMIEHYDSIEEAQTAADKIADAYLREGQNFKIIEVESRSGPVWTMNLSEKLKSAAEKGLPYMAVVPPAAMMMNQEQDRTPINRAAARPIMENYAN